MHWAAAFVSGCDTPGRFAGEADFPFLIRLGATSTACRQTVKVDLFRLATTRGRCLGFNEVEEIQQRIAGIVDLMGQKGSRRTTGCLRSNSLCCFRAQWTPGIDPSQRAEYTFCLIPDRVPWLS